MDTVLAPQTSLRESYWRWIALFFQAFFAFGFYYANDNPQAIKTRLLDPPTSLTGF